MISVENVLNKLLEEANKLFECMTNGLTAILDI